MSVVTYFVPRYIYIESLSFLFANIVVVGFSELRPEFLMLVAVPWEVEHAANNNVVCIIYNDRGKHPDSNSGPSVKRNDSPWIIFKRVLHPLAVMHIPVNYQHPGQIF